MNVDSIFLHMGPGFNAKTEKSLLGRLWPGVCFWDQPPARSYRSLIQAAEESLNAVFEGANKPVNIVAHSFGVHLGRALLERCPDRVGNCHFIAPCMNPYQGFYRLAQVLADSEWVPDSWRERFEETLSQTSSKADFSSFWQLISVLLECDNFMRAYWVEGASYESYRAIANRHPGIDLETFHDVLESFYSENPNQTAYINKNQSFDPTSVHFYLGQADPFVDVQKEESCWLKIFPQASITVFEDSGHFPHLEGQGVSWIAESLKGELQ